MVSCSEKMAALLAKKEREHREKLEQLNRNRGDRMKSLERDCNDAGGSTVEVPARRRGS